MIINSTHVFRQSTEIWRQMIVFRIHDSESWFILYVGWIPRIFRSFFCARIFYFWPFHMKAHIKKCKKMLKFFRLFLNSHDFFDFFEVFRIKTFLCSEMQSRGMHHKIRHKIPHRTVHVTSLWDVVGKRYHVFYRFYGGWKLRRFTQNQINLHQKVSQNHRTVINSNEVNFH